ncbi:MAG: sensor histidine kinase [Pseudonocardiaceae bacterium]
MAVVLGVCTTVVVFAGSHVAYAEVRAILALGTGWTFVVAGLVAWRRRPDSRVGVLMCAVGLAKLLRMVIASDQEWLFAIGLALDFVPLALYGHLLLAFPAGQLESRLAQVVVAGAYIDATVVQLATLLLIPDPCPSCPPNPLAIFPYPLAALRLAWGQRAIGLALISVMLVILFMRWRRASPARRRVMAPVLGTASLLLLATFAVAFAVLGDPSPNNNRLILVLDWIYTVALTAAALGCLAGLLRSSLDRAGVADLIVRLGRTAPPGGLRRALAEALHDPSLSVLYWIPEQDRFVHPDGRPAVLPAADEDSRVTTLVERDGTRIAALVHDPVVSDEPQLLEAVCAAAGFALENERLQAELRARVDELAASRTRLVQVADAERRRLERNLHDGAQQRLVAVSMSLGRAASTLLTNPAAAGAALGEARATLTTALQELRELSRGLHPSGLAEHGLAAALEELVWTTPLPVTLRCRTEGRLAESVETTAYYVVAEALTNVVKHADATRACIDVAHRDATLIVTVTDDGHGGADPADGSGLRGLADRVHALGGTLQVTSPPGRGTTLTARLPCAS